MTTTNSPVTVTKKGAIFFCPESWKRQACEWRASAHAPSCGKHTSALWLSEEECAQLGVDPYQSMFTMDDIVQILQRAFTAEAGKFLCGKHSSGGYREVS